MDIYLIVLHIQYGAFTKIKSNRPLSEKLSINCLKRKISVESEDDHEAIFTLHWQKGQSS